MILAVIYDSKHLMQRKPLECYRGQFWAHCCLYIGDHITYNDTFLHRQQCIPCVGWGGGCTYMRTRHVFRVKSVMLLESLPQCLHPGQYGLCGISGARPSDSTCSVSNTEVKDKLYIFIKLEI